MQRANGWGEALALAREMRPSAVLLDSGFLEGAGPELCGALRRAWGTDETPVLALCRGSREVTRALSAGATDVVEKPIDWDLVERRLRTLASIRHTRTELEHNRRQLAQARAALADGRRQFEHGSLFDSLTGLPNRLQIETMLERALRADAGPVALFAVDLDRFSELNETLGREAGDEILRLSGERLTDCLRTWPGRRGAGPGVISAARLGGAEFAVMLQDSDEQRLGDLARLVLEALEMSLIANGKELHLTASIGIAIVAQGTVTPETLLRHAETAMYEAKRGGVGYRVYSEEIGVTAEIRRNMDSRLRDAFARGALELHYQPVLAASSRRVLSVEALLRWSDGDRGFVPPSEFIPVAEAMGLMGALGVWVLDTACRQLRSWLDDSLPPIRVAVNVSRRQLEFGDFASEVDRVLRETGLDPGLLELEMSERGGLRRSPTVLAQLRRLKARGVRLVVDDFGTGETAVGQLRLQGVHGLKIDGSFVRDTKGADGPAITAAMAAMGRELRLHVVAEGVETQAELEKMREYGCDAVQGFLFSKPLPPAELRQRMRVPMDRPGMCELAVAV
jgi:diguanylate cyclase (GGDEF)-like protein